ncbi:MAG: helix-turn-helix domain-containing protein [Burkholderiales bacterium]|nr:MAG: helix-turn-helix domain-containing protein [Burkholderiales bacterium]
MDEHGPDSPGEAAMDRAAADEASVIPSPAERAERAEPPRDPFLVALGERARSLRARRGMTRRALSSASEVSERHLANLELGVGNASILVLRQVAQALGAPLAELIGDETTAGPEWLLIRDLLAGRDEDELRRARIALGDLFGESARAEARAGRIALVGLRGAGKSTLGRMLADALALPFVELNRELERVAGCSLAEIHGLLGPAAYRRYERRALEETIQLYPDAVIATPGGIVSDPATFNLLLAHCTTVWLKASPEEHMQRVVAQGDLRPMAGNQEAMDDLKRILAGRAAFYGRADRQVDTSGRSLGQAFDALREAVREATGR